MGTNYRLESRRINLDRLNVQSTFTGGRIYSYRNQIIKVFDDDENRYSFDTYNMEGDFILPREGNETDTHIMQPLDEYTLNTITPELVSSLNEVYQSLLDKNLKVYCEVARFPYAYFLKK